MTMTIDARPGLILPALSRETLATLLLAGAAATVMEKARRCPAPTRPLCRLPALPGP